MTIACAEGMHYNIIVDCILNPVYSLGLNYFGQCGAEPSLMQTKEGAGLGGQLKLRDMLAETGVDKVKQVKKTRFGWVN